jgi:hypothetical protein
MRVKGRIAAEVGAEVVFVASFWVLAAGRRLAQLVALFLLAATSPAARAHT